MGAGQNADVVQHLHDAGGVAGRQAVAVLDHHGLLDAALALTQQLDQAFVDAIDFGPDIGIRKSSAQITVHYAPETLVGRQVLAVVNFPPRQIGPFRSEVLTLGFADGEGAIVLAQPGLPVPNGGKLL